MFTSTRPVAHFPELSLFAVVRMSNPSRITSELDGSASPLMLILFSNVTPLLRTRFPLESLTSRMPKMPSVSSLSVSENKCVVFAVMAITPILERGITEEFKGGLVNTGYCQKSQDVLYFR